MQKINWNTVLLMLLLSLGGWTLHEVNQQGRDFATINEKLSNQTILNAETRTRLLMAEVKISELEIKVAQISR